MKILYKWHPNLESWHEWHNGCLKYTMLCSKVLFAINNSLNARPKRPFVSKSYQRGNYRQRHTKDMRRPTSWIVSKPFLGKFIFPRGRYGAPKATLRKRSEQSRGEYTNLVLTVPRAYYKLLFELCFINTGPSQFVLFVYHRNSFDLNNATIK